MSTPTDLSGLMSTAPQLGVSIFLPTQIRGREIRQAPIRLKNLMGEALDGLLSAGLSRAEADAFLAPAAALVNDYGFWQHQDQGLALFLDGGEARLHQVPFPLPERVVVGPGFHVRPLLAGWAAEGTFGVLTITADRVRLFHASRFSLTEEEGEDLPRGLGEELGEPDYENPGQASPVARPHTGSVDISYAQVYGDSPAEWRKGRLVEYTRRVAAAVDQRMVSRPVPLVLAADTEIAGHFRKSSRLGPLLAGVIKANPEAMDDTQLHDAAYTVVRPRLDADRQDALDRFEALHASGDVRAATGVTEVVRAAHQGRVDTLLLTETGPIWGRYDRTADQVVTYESYGASGQDLLDVAAIQTLHNGGLVHLMTPDTMPGAAAAAILRY